MLRIASVSYLGHKKKHDEMIKEKGISNNFCYEMLAMPKYQEKLQYIPQYKRKETAEEKESSWAKTVGVGNYKHSDICRQYCDHPFVQDN